MNQNDTLLEKHLTERCNYFENESKIARQRIRKSLDERHAIKANIAAGRERANTYLQILERLDEFEKLGRLQLEAAEKMEDPESLKKLEIIKKYESMVREQEEVWAKYEEEYEQLPTAQERRKVKLELLKTSIQIKLLYYKIDEKKKMIKLKKQISKRREQLAIIKFVKFLVEYKNREKQFFELQSKVKALKKRQQELREEIQQLEQLKANRSNKINIIEKQSHVGSLSLPAMDFSCFIVLQKSDINKDDAKTADTISMYSLNLEQEYMNNEDDADKNLSKTSAEQSKMKESNPQNSGSQETNAETLMDVNTEELSETFQENVVIPRRDKKDHSTIYNDANSKNYGKEVVNKSGRDAAKKRVSQNLAPEDCSNNENIGAEQRNSRDLPERPMPMPPKMPKRVHIYEGYSNCENAHNDQTGNLNRRTPCSPEVTAKVQQWQRTFSPKNAGPQMETNEEPQHHYQQQSQQQRRQQQQRQHQQHFNHKKFQRQQQRQEQQGRQQPYQEQQRQQQQQKTLQQQQQKKPAQQQQLQHQPQSQQQQQQRQPLQQQQSQRKPLQQQQQQHQPKPLQQQQQQQRPMSWSPSIQKDADRQNVQDFSGILQSNKPLIISNKRVNYDTQHIFQEHIKISQATKQQTDTDMEVTYHESETFDAPPQVIEQTPSVSNENKSPTDLQSNQLVTPPHRSIIADSMMSANMYSSDTNMSADNISAILGSEISEPGGILGLINHIHGEDDNMSEVVEPNFENIMSKFCSPMQPENSRIHQQPIHNGNNQNSDQLNDATANHGQQDHVNRKFSILQFGQKNQSNSSQHLF